ncbi:MAG: LysM peptidoglycan-binding domain-containing protein [Anaerolineae bacterium]|nr:LysM peptidoglycan-binding domain-containing protein [Anaerolineae bacterium]
MVEVTPLSGTPTPTAQIELVTVTPRATSTAVPATPLPTFTATPTPTPVIHIVQAGETLLDLSYQYGVSVQALIEVNGIENPRALSIGQELIIPYGDENHLEQQPTPTPTPMPLRVVNVAFHQTPAGSLWCMGEVQNERDEVLEFVQVQVSLHNADGELVELGTTFVASEIVPGQGVAPFALLLPDVPLGSWASYQIVVRSAEPLTHWGERYGDLVVQDLHGEMNGRLFHVEGLVANKGEVAAHHICLFFTLYARDGTVVGVRQSEMPAVITAGAREPFAFDLIPLAPAADASALAWGLGSEP